MFTFDETMENIFEKCVPFGEGEIAGGEDCQSVHRELRAVRSFLERRDPQVMACIDSYIDTYLGLVDLECRHYFAEGYRLGLEKIVALNSKTTPAPPKNAPAGTSD